MVRLLPFLVLLCCITFNVRAQQVATYAQYMFNGLAINPAYAGSHEALSATALGRFQNVGLRGAPNTQTFSIHSPLLFNRASIGALVIHDQLSVINQTGVHFMYAYRIPVDKESNASISFGIQGGLSMYRANYTQLDIKDPDPAFSEDVRSARPNIGAGVYYSTKWFYVGLSAPSLMNNVLDRNEDLHKIYQSKPLILTAGYVFTLNRMVKLKPNTLLKFIDGSPVEFDFNLNALFDEVLWVGVSYKSSNQVVLMSQMQINDQLQFGYSYTITAGPIRTVELGSHEIMLNYKFKFYKKGVLSPRYF